MSIDNPVGPDSKDPYEKYRQIQEQIEKEDKGGGKPPSRAFKWLILKKLLDAIENLLNFPKYLVGPSELIVNEHLQLLKKQFSLMAQENRSQDIEFLNTLADIWHKILEFSVLFRRTDAFSIAFRSFVKKIQNYPENQEHTFGYYLNEYTGETWLPFPYMELIEKLYEEYLMQKETSSLMLWILEIEELSAALSQT